MATIIRPETEAQLAEFIAQFYCDPVGLVKVLYPWGRPLTWDGEVNPLRDKDGPDVWQTEFLDELGEFMRDNLLLTSMDLQTQVWRSAVASGHGVGKSALVAWIIQFFMNTRRDTRGVVTASTQFQLEDKTWPELAKWHHLSLTRHWFEWTATSYYFKPYPEDRQKNYRFVAATVSEQKSEAFQGLHNEGKAVVVIFDEASGVAPKIWNVSDGAVTDGEGFLFAFGNPTRPDGDFADCFDKHAELYKTRHVDSRSVKHTNKNAIADMLKKYGSEEDEEFRVRVRGLFPNQSFDGFISRDGVYDAIRREIDPDAGAALIMAIDVARFGNDRTVFGWRQGRDQRSFPMRVFTGLSVVKVAEIAMQEIIRTRPDAVVIEATGPGAGVIDILRSRGTRVIEVHPGAAATEHRLYVNRRAEIWALMRDWIYERGAIVDDPELVHELISIKYNLDRHEQRYQLEAKHDMKARGLSSPDKADTLALTFAAPVLRRDANARRASAGRQTRAVTEYDEFAH